MLIFLVPWNPWRGKEGPEGGRGEGGMFLFCKTLITPKTQSSLTVKRGKSCHKPTAIQLRPERNKAAELVFADYHFPLNPLRLTVHPSLIFLIARDWPFIALPYSFINSLHPKSCLSSLPPPPPPPPPPRLHLSLSPFFLKQVVFSVYRRLVLVGGGKRI